MMVPRFSRQYDAGLGALNVELWENIELAVFLVLESKALQCFPVSNALVGGEGKETAPFLLVCLLY